MGWLNENSTSSFVFLFAKCDSLHRVYLGEEHYYGNIQHKQACLCFFFANLISLAVLPKTNMSQDFFMQNTFNNIFI